MRESRRTNRNRDYWANKPHGKIEYVEVTRTSSKGVVHTKMSRRVMVPTSIINKFKNAIGVK